MKTILPAIIMLLGLLTCQAQHKLLPPVKFAREMAASKGQVIDVRTPKEYKAGRIAYAVNLHVYDKDFEQRINKLDKNKPVYVYCKVGGRSAEAVAIMKANNFKNIVELEGGMDAWTEAGQPVQK
ncbi:hypothetical protein CHU92_13600 [Flavobacterium cyanobacteriorum]|uniref:Rhodanese domain-containing protein n=1 Tax=Flavobacterium cyanobacteriorum TaxID=2022802 RepID=A0A255YVC8_9FLAO|nr:rhodanese-like domain-containing protein [Flavobacterium cyanobacteriorum]OYQ33168.1 hypothetical protein CHU92_13600 [Flavobacterium cyanobacteriorum]